VHACHLAHRPSLIAPTCRLMSLKTSSPDTSVAATCSPSPDYARCGPIISRFTSHSSMELMT
jgi:hypothetical protein